MIKVLSIVYYAYSARDTTERMAAQHRPVFDFTRFLPASIQFHFIKHANKSWNDYFGSAPVSFFKGRNRFWHCARAAHRYARRYKPDIVLVEGLGFPFQILLLRMAVGNNCRIMVRHHGERPYSGIKLLFQRWADRCIAQYLFTAKGLAAPWENKKVLSAQKCIEVPEASTGFKAADRQKSKSITGLPPGPNFLWVGRLIPDKDPMTVLAAFALFAQKKPGVKLWMIYQDADLLPGIQKQIAADSRLQESVELVGQVSHEILHYWYSAADYFISASLREGSGYALLEAMACGCIPVLSSIPAFQQLTGNGRVGHLFKTGNVDSLFNTLQRLDDTGIEAERQRTLSHFANHLTAEEIAKKMQVLFVSRNTGKPII